jgi:hypothetical protein
MRSGPMHWITRAAHGAPAETHAAWRRNDPYPRGRNPLKSNPSPQTAGIAQRYRTPSTKSVKASARLDC